MKTGFMRIGMSICFLLLLASCSNYEDQCKSLTYEWNELHNSHNTEKFEELYDTEVLFYGFRYTKSKCIAIKKKFLSSSFEQEIISPLVLYKYSSGVIKCDFTKRTHSKKGIKEHLCYLLFKEVNNKLQITGESDFLSDQKRNVQLNLGTIQSGSKGYYILTSLLILLIGSGIYFVRRKRKSDDGMGIYTSEAVEEKIELKSSANLKVDTIDKNVEKGRLFENYITAKFHEVFKLKEWRGDKIHEGRYAHNNMYPDMEWELILPNVYGKFAVECKYRSQYINNSVDIAKEYQLNNYRNYSKENKIPVFIILGVGGLPDNPSEIFIIPLSEIQSPILYKGQLARFRKAKVTGTFGYNVYTKELL